tara:strand:+ start:27890 stop:28270 length:381 start_codon:yes stop_codon:yes gene_type:complete
MKTSDDFDPEDIDIEGWVETGDFGRKVQKLEYPIEVSIEDSSGRRTDRITHIEYRRPVGRDLDRLEKMEGSNQVFSATREFVHPLIFGDDRVTLSKLGELDAADSLRSAAIAFSFFPQPRRKTSAK